MPHSHVFLTVRHGLDAVIASEAKQSQPKIAFTSHTIPTITTPASNRS